MTTPVFIPLHHSTSPTRCPKCGGIEQKVEICDHCGYRYPESDMSILTVLFIIILGLVLFIWIGSTLLDWWFGNDSLIEVLKGQWEWVKSRRIW